jgi:ribosomal protein S21
MAKVIQYVDEMTGERESIDSMLRRFKKQVIKDEILDDLRKHEYYISKSAIRRAKKLEAIRKNKFEQMQTQGK